LLNVPGQEKRRAHIPRPAPPLNACPLAMRAGFAAAAVARFSALAGDFALLGRIHCCKAPLRTATLGCCHLLSPWLRRFANVVLSAAFTMLMEVSELPLRRTFVANPC
jgi:hypothetical protein